MSLATQESSGVSLIRTSQPIPDSLPCFYFEIKIIDCGHSGAIGIGLTSQDARTDTMPGWDDDADGIGFHGNDGEILDSHSGWGEQYERFTTGDIVSCQVTRVQMDELNFLNLIQFGKNGETVGQLRYIESTALYPSVGMHTRGAIVQTLSLIHI